jgi:hypothetical protein
MRKCTKAMLRNPRQNEPTQILWLLGAIREFGPPPSKRQYGNERRYFSYFPENVTSSDDIKKPSGQSGRAKAEKGAPRE